MYITTAPSLFLGLGARIFVNKFVYHYDSSTIPDFVFLGLWQGTALYYLLMRQVEFAWAASVGILGRLLIDFVQTWDTSRCACTLLGVALGVLVTDIASQFIEDDSGRPAIFGGGSPSSGHHHHRKRPSRRLVQFSRSNSLVEPVRSKGKEAVRGDGGRDRDRTRHNKHKDEKLEDFKRLRDWESRSIITADSITSSDLIHPKSKMTPLQREVANLRAKASLADTERRRFKEEKQWALSQGNSARAEQMGWQVKRYAALVDSFHKEADVKLLEGALLSLAFSAIDISPRLGCQHLGSSLLNGQNRTQHLFDQEAQKLTQTSSHLHLHPRSSALNSRGRDAAHLASNQPSEYQTESG